MHLYMYASIYIKTYVCLLIDIPKHIHSYSIHAYIHQNHMMLTLGTVTSHVACYFDHLCLRNAMVPIMMPTVVCDVDTSASGKT